MAALTVLGIETATAWKIVDAVLAGMDVAAAVAIMGGVTTVAGAAIAVIRRLVGKATAGWLIVA